MRIDIIIPSCKTLSLLAAQLYAVRTNTRTEHSIITTCLDACASKNRNVGLEKAESNLIIMMDDDVIGFHPGWEEELIAIMQDSEVVMASPRLITPAGAPGLMLGHPPPLTNGERWAVPDRELPTACIIIRKNELRFDENFIGSGWEDTDYCAQLRQKHPQGKFIVTGKTRITHKNEMKNQAGEIFEKNKAYFFSKWG